MRPVPHPLCANWASALESPPLAGSRLRPRLATVLRNLVRNRARADKRWAERARRLAPVDDAPLPTADDLLAYHQAQRLVAELVADLEEPRRSTVRRCYGQGVPPSEVATRQGIPAGTVRWRLKRGLDDLRARLDPRYGGDRHAWGVALAPLVAGRALVPVAGPGWAAWKIPAVVSGAVQISSPWQHGSPAAPQPPHDPPAQAEPFEQTWPGATQVPGRL